MSRKYGRETDGTFAPGNPGKPRGARNKSTKAALALLDGEAEQLSRKAVELALAGDVTALRLCLERIAPPRRDTPVDFELSPISSTADAVCAAGEVLSAVASAELSPVEGAQVMALIESFRRILEAEELERRLSALEEALDGKD